MSDWAIYFPTGTTNLNANPSLESNLNGYIAKGSSTLNRSSSFQAYGAYSLSVTPSAGVNDGVIFTGTSFSAGVYNGSLAGYFPTGVTYRLYFGDTANVVLGTPTIITGTNSWNRYSVQWTETGTAVRRLIAEKNNNASVAAFFIDGIQIENGPLTSYCDGEQLDCNWQGLPHSSTSVRPNTATRGGIEYDLFDTYGFKVTAAFGIGAVPITNIPVEYASLPGSYLQGAKTNERQVNLAGVFVANSKADLHSKRSALLNALLPGRGKNIILDYKLKNLRLDCVYDSGLEFGETDGFNEKVNIRFIAYDNPYWREEFQQGLVLPSRNVPPAIYTNMAQRTSNGWGFITTGTNAAIASNKVYAIVNDYYGNTYYAGIFRSTVELGEVNGMFRYNASTNAPEKFAGGGIHDNRLVGNFIYDSVLAPDGNVIFVGFTQSGTATATNARGVVAYNPATNSWSAYATGTTNNTVDCATFDKDGNLVVGGYFTQLNSQTLYQLAKRSPAGVWSALKVAADFGSVIDITLNKNGNLYFVATVSGSATGGLYYFDPANTTYNLVNSFTPNGDKVISTPDGMIYFTKSNNIYSYDGQNVRMIGATGLSGGALMGLTYDSKRNIVFAVGGFTTADNLTLADGIVGYNGSSFIQNDIDINGVSQYFTTCFYNPITDSLSTVFLVTGTVNGAVNFQPVSNNSTVNTYPVIEFTNTGTASAIRLCEIQNKDTGATVYLNLAINPGEVITVDFRPNKKMVSSNFRGIINNCILPGSVFANWFIYPGKTSIGLFADNDLAVRAYWDISHISGDSK